MTPAQNILGLGLYELPVAAKLAGSNWQRVNRLVFNTKISERVWEPKIQLDDAGPKVISFHDLMEIRAIEFLLKRVSLQKIRKAHNLLVEELGVDYPFSSRKVQTDGASVILAESCMDVFSRQYNARDLIDQSIENIVFDDDLESPSKWWVHGKDKGIIIDPSRRFGSPIDDSTGIQTNAIYERYLLNNDYNDTAMFFDVPNDVVQNACEFEKSLLHANATSVRP